MVIVPVLCLIFCVYRSVQKLVQAYVKDSEYEIRFNSDTADSEYTTTINLYEEEYLLNTPGCAIPNVWRNYTMVEANNCENRCGIRLVQIEKKNRNMITFTINDTEMKKLLGNYKCCSKFASLVGPDALRQTPCQNFQNGTETEFKHEVVLVTCRTKGKRKKLYSSIYEDAFIFVRERRLVARKSDKNSWNVLILGMDTTSRARAIQGLTRLVKYLKMNDWLDFRAFQKSQPNTFPNVMNLLTGKSPSTYDKACSTGIQQCNHIFIWNEYQLRNYVTAYAEDGLSDTFLPKGQFKMPPTTHYTRTLFQSGVEYKGNIVCTYKRENALHVLDYARQFATTYRDKKFFGYFWLATYTHDPNFLVTLLQDHLIDFYTELYKAGVLNNTFIFFIGDHGVRFGSLKLPVQSHYDDRLPMLYVWLPPSFRDRYETEYISLRLNQHRLVTHCDVYLTLRNILQLSDKSFQIGQSDACPKCKSLFVEISQERRCADINVNEKWCSCHDLTEVDPNDAAASEVPYLLLRSVEDYTKTKLEIRKVLRLHWYKDVNETDDVTYYVVVIEVTPGNKQHEAVIKKVRSEYAILEDYDTISPYANFYNTSHCKPLKAE